MSYWEDAKKIAGGPETLSEWIGSGGMIVDASESQARAEICAICPKNVKRYSFLKPIANAVRRHMALKNQLKIEVRGEERLHICEACCCVLRLKVHLPMSRIRPTDDERKNYHPDCWLLKP